LCAYFATERVGLDVVGEGPRPVDLDHGNQLAVARLQLLVAGDIDLSQVEVELLVQFRQRRARPVAQVAVRRVVEDDFGYG
jgi:hypothetical protein